MEKRIWSITIIVLLLVIVGLLGNLTSKINSLYLEIRYKIEYQNDELENILKEMKFFKHLLFKPECIKKRVG